MPGEEVQQLLEQAQALGMLTADDVQRVGSALHSKGALTADEVAVQLVKERALTSFQVQQLMAGRGEDCVLGGRYQLLELLGTGGMGTVYMARDTQLNRTVAIKVMAAHLLGDAGAVARFQREARALAQVSHPAIVQAYDSGQDKGRHYLVMEYVPGTSLAQLLKEERRIPPLVAAEYIHQVALGLQHAHHKGLVHRDLKPANLLLTPHKQVKVLDLGLARFVQDQIGEGSLTREGTGMGTPDYMAPEQFRNARSVDPRADIYSLGCTLYHLLAGQVPFPGSSLSEKAKAHEEEEPPDLEERCPDAPTGLVLVVRRMMAKRPADRFQTAGELAEALVLYLSASSLLLPRLKTAASWKGSQLAFTVPKRRFRTMRWVLAGTAVAALLVVLACFVSWVLNAETHTFGGGQSGVSHEPSDPNVLTVAQDGSGQFGSMNEALEKVQAGQTVRVLDDATYAEALTLNDAQKYTGLLLEATKGATILLTGQSRHALSIRDVPNLRVKGFRLRDSGAVRGSTFVQVSSHCPGVMLEGLDIQAVGQVNGLVLENVVAKPGESPLILTHCLVRAGYHGIVVDGSDRNGGGPPRSGGIQIRQNRVSAAGWGIQIRGAVSRIHVAGNLVWNCGLTGIQLQDLVAGSNQVLIANNTVSQSTAGFRVWDNEPFETHSQGQVEVCNNVLLDAIDVDMGYYQAPKGGKTIPGDGQALLKLWRFDRNWRDLSGQESDKAIPLAPNDKKLAGNALLARESSHKDYLRPAKESPLVTAGAGGDLPSYAGAVPPEGIAPWDWDKTWEARVK
jgi:hypothetical protein